MKRALLLAAVLSALSVAPAFAAPHGEQVDGCDHGASSKPCRPDPQPDHGKECAVHGNHGGVNEDHCATTTTLPETTTTTTQPALTGTPETTSTTAAGPATSAPEAPTSGAVTAPLSPAASATELPRTGAASRVLLGIAVWCLLGGLVSLAWAQVIRGAK